MEDTIRKSEISVLEAERAGEIVSPRLLAKAHRRPKGVSEVRWRMELRRRENGDYFRPIAPPGGDGMTISPRRGGAGD